MTCEAVLDIVAGDADEVASLQRAALADSTVEEYERLWDRFEHWCAAHDIDPLDAGGKALAVWVHEEAWDKRPSTTRRYCNAVSWGCRRVGGIDPSADGLTDRLLAAHARMHGVAPLEANTVKSFERDELVAVVSAPFHVRGGADVAVLRNRCVALLASREVPARQLYRVATDGVKLDDGAVIIDLPAIEGQGVSQARRIAGAQLRMPLRDDELDPRQLLDLADTGGERSLLFGVVTVDGGGRYAAATGIRTINSTHGIAGTVETAFKAAGRRSALAVQRVDDVQHLDTDELCRLVAHLNASYLTELRTRAHAATLAATGGRHSDFTHVRVETAKKTTTGWRVFVEQSKTDRAGAGAWKTVPHTPGHPPTCPACLLTKWVTEARLTSGPLFPSLAIGGRVKTTPVAVEEAAQELQRLAARLNIDKRVGTHSMRKTHATLRAQQGDEAWQIAATTGQTADVVLRHYVRPARVIGDTSQL